MNKFKEALAYIPNLKNYNTLDIFAREGDWQSFILEEKVKSLEAWEIEKKFIPNLKKNLSNSIIKCKDSISFINSKPTNVKFELVIIDNGLNCYGKNYCEHFDFLHNIKHILTQESYIIFNVVTQPFNYKKNIKWQSRRNSFYNKKDCSKLDIEFMQSFYLDFFNKNGLDVLNSYTLCREYNKNIDYLYYMVMKLNKI
tara:strand:+ start:6895 stop:7488 length:594 start_codon:yes stop_codon:yes gene_type:complete